MFHKNTPVSGEEGTRVFYTKVYEVVNATLSNDTNEVVIAA
ncbi:MAG: hypothetical protein PUH94_00620 [Firmicutes bacterium]|nr:hypothetical protein [Bacillota bacterium]